MKLIRVSMLVLALSVCAYGGVMDNGKTAPPPPAPSTVKLEETDTSSAAGHIGTPVAPTDDTVTLAVLNLLQSVLALL